MKGTLSVMEVEPTRFLHIRSDFGQTEMFFRMEPEGDATRLSADADWEMPGHIPGFIKNLMTKSLGRAVHAPADGGLQGARRGAGPGQELTDRSSRVPGRPERCLTASSR